MLGGALHDESMLCLPLLSGVPAGIPRRTNSSFHSLCASGGSDDPTSASVVGSDGVSGHTGVLMEPKPAKFSGGALHLGALAHLSLGCDLAGGAGGSRVGGVIPSETASGFMGLGAAGPLIVHFALCIHAMTSTTEPMGTGGPRSAWRIVYVDAPYPE